MTIFMSATNIPGDVTAKGFENQIELQSVSWDVTHNGPPFSSDGEGNGQPEVDTITITKLVDKASVPLLKAALQDTAISSVIITFARQGSSGAYARTLTLGLSGVTVYKYSISDGGGDAVPTESLDIAFTKIAFKHSAETSAPQVQYTVNSNTTN